MIPQKAVAAGGATAFAGAMTTLILAMLNHPVSPDIAGAMTTVISTVISFVATYYTKHEGGQS